MKISSKEIIDNLDKLIPNPKCELVYHKDYELLIATVLSAQSTDKRVNIVTEKLFQYNIFELKDLDIKVIEEIIKPVGTYQRKALYIKEICAKLISDYNGVVPNNREYLESLKGVGRKTTNLVLALLFNTPTFPVDTHVERVSKRLGLAKPRDNVLTVEKKLMKIFPRNLWNRLHHQFVLFGRYTCKSVKPLCDNCPFKLKCLYYNEKQK